VRKDQVNDLLKSLTVVERESGKAVSVSMPLDPQTWANAALATLRPGQGSLAEVLDSLRGRLVTLAPATAVSTAGSRWSSRSPSRPRRRRARRAHDHRVTLLDGDDAARRQAVDGARPHARGRRPRDAVQPHARRLSAGEGMFQQVEVVDPAGRARTSHDLLVSYVVAAPMWKPTYRVVLPKGARARRCSRAGPSSTTPAARTGDDVRLGAHLGRADRVPLRPAHPARPSSAPT
jgi:hypothetical protein